LPDLEVGSVVADRYRLDRVLGEGGMGIVYAATHTRTRKSVAIKVLRASMSADQATRQRFLREARAACAVRHPNVVEIHDVIELADGTPPMIVMELLEGESLASRLKRETVVPLGELATLILPVVAAVGSAHEVGIVHRDLKPDNIFLDRRRGTTDVHVLDFGIAKLTATEGDAASSAAITGTGAVLGTPYYMSPEQVFGEKDIDHRADIWALGVILYECLAGVRPTQADNIGQVFKIVMTDAIKPIERLVPGLPASVVQLIGRMLTREREKRPQDLREVASLLADLAGQQVPSIGEPVAAVVRVSLPGDAPQRAKPDRVVATPRESTTAAGEFDDTVEQPSKPDGRASTQSPITVSATERRRSRRRNPVAIGAVVAVMGILGAAGAAFLRNDSGKPAAPPAVTMPAATGAEVPTVTAPPQVSQTSLQPLDVPTAATASAAESAPVPVFPPRKEPAGNKRPSKPAPAASTAAASPPPASPPPAPSPAPAPAAPAPKPTIDPASYQ
jgi:serine/threonine protein kinase